jgi:hypothetical protein
MLLGIILEFIERRSFVEGVFRAQSNDQVLP